MPHKYSYVEEENVLCPWFLLQSQNAKKICTFVSVCNLGCNVNSPRE